MTARIAVGSRVRIVWPSTHDGLTGVVTSIDGTNNTLGSTAGVVSTPSSSITAGRSAARVQ